MADRFPAEILIYGPCPDALLPALVDAAEGDGTGLEYDDPPPSVEELQELLEDMQPGPLGFADYEASSGELNCLTRFCQTLGLGYLHRNDSYAEYDAATSWWQPGMDRVRSSQTSNRGDILVSVDQLKTLRKEAKRPEDVVAALDRMIADHEIPEFEPFALISGEPAMTWLLERVRQTPTPDAKTLNILLDAINHYRERGVAVRDFERVDLLPLLESDDSGIRQKAVLLLSVFQEQGDGGPQGPDRDSPSNPTMSR